MNTIVEAWILTASLLLFAFVTAQDFQYNNIVGISEGQSCDPLPNPEHGNFKCILTSHGEECELKCQAGYVPPITYTPKNTLMNVKRRGIYRCVHVPGGLTWEPDILFDCVERIIPKNFILHYAISMPLGCQKNNTEKTEKHHKELNDTFTKKSQLLRECKKLEVGIHDPKCAFKLYLTCIDTSYEADLELIIPLNDTIAANFPETRKKFDGINSKKSEKDTIWKLKNQVNETEISLSDFFMDCPRGTRLEGDFTCRGCSKGYYLDEEVSDCTPCKKGTYQDENFQVYCKICPDGAIHDRNGLRDRRHCFYSGLYIEYTNVETVLKALFCIVTVFTVFTLYRRNITNEPGPNTVERNPFAKLIQKAIEDDKRAQVGTEIGSGDFESKADSKSTRFMIAGMPIDFPIFIGGWRAKAKQRLKMTLNATLMKKTGQKPEVEQVHDSDDSDVTDFKSVIEDDSESRAQSWLRNRITQVIKKK